ncbi:multidrug effflux MFS transporter [Acetobacter vaccinii]|uniref:Bcr/CflA family efflux transporter n=1 Tax=Acetobacter vaccinii TaxID=2592655 RepID=A0A5C1YPZ7_9PROT|nr:multidrug effflux MFS transporter [Acetobacter vaccinii]QEO16872.1 multidrug effflux MFS transporter [Acetobacter vaccinii]
MPSSSVFSSVVLTRPLIVLLGLVTAIGPLATDMYLPAFPELESELGGGAGSAQFTLGAWFLGLAVGQFSQGPLSDRFGRKAPLIIGLLVFALASAGCAIVHDYHWFCFYRFLGALGGSASAVIPRAIVRDVATGRKGAHIMAQLTLVFGVMPVLAPSLGSLVLRFGSWRDIFWLGTVYGVLAIVGVLTMLPDTLAMDRRIFLRPAGIVSRYYGILREPVFLTNALITSFSSFVMFAYLGSAPMVFEQLLGFSPLMFGVFFGVNAAFFILGTQINGRLTHRVALTKLLERSILWVSFAGCVFVGLSLAGIAGAGHPLLVCLLIVSMTGGLGFIGPNGTVLSFSRHGQHAGSASAMLGTIQFSLGACGSVLVGVLPGGGTVPTATGMLVGALGMLVCDIVRRRIGQHEPDPED